MKKTQEEIIIDNLKFNLSWGEYKSYPFKSIGNIIHWLQALGFLQYDTVQIGNYKVTLYDELVATYTFDTDNQMPIFSFQQKWDWVQKTHDLYRKHLCNVVICENCKSYWVLPVNKCSCGSTSLVQTHKSNMAYAENIKSRLLRIKQEHRAELVSLYDSRGGLSGVSKEDIDEIYVFKSVEGSNYNVAMLKDKKRTLSLNWERFEII